jgi:hypothetical protein
VLAFGGEDFALGYCGVDDAFEEAFVEGMELGFEFAEAGSVLGDERFFGFELAGEVGEGVLQRGVLEGVLRDGRDG